MTDILKLHINECQPGMEITNKIESRFGGIIIPQGTKLTEEMIIKLKIIGEIEYLNIKKDDFPCSVNQRKKLSANQLDAQFNYVYKISLEGIKQVFYSLNLGKKLNTEIIKNISQELIVFFNQYINIFKHLNTLGKYDEYTYTHSLNVASIATMIGKWLNYTHQDLINLTYAGLLHDIGKSQVVPNIINKPGPLTEDEARTVQRHPTYGYKIIRNYHEFNENVLMGVLMHHEQKSGKGYPIGLKEEQIHPFAKIIAVADIYDAMTSRRVYKDAFSPLSVLKHLVSLSFDSTDPLVTSTFVRYAIGYFIGEEVILNNQQKAKIVYIDPNNIDRPLVFIPTNTVIDLRQNKTLKILSFS